MLGAGVMTLAQLALPSPSGLHVPGLPVLDKPLLLFERIGAPWRPVLAASIGIGVDGPVVDFGPISPADDPPVLRRAVQLAVESDEPWHVTLAAASDFVNHDPEVASLPAERLQWALDGSATGRWQPLSTTPVVLAEGPGGEGTAAVSLSLRLEIGWDDPPAATPYQTTLVYTASPGAVLVSSFARPEPAPPDGPIRYTIGYWVPGGGLVPIRLRLTDSTGAPVRTVTLEQAGGRWHTWLWDGRDDAGRPLPPDPYYYTITGPDGRVLAAGWCYPPEGNEAAARAVEVRTLHVGIPTSPAWRLEATAQPQQVSAGDWLRLDWQLENPGPQSVEDVRLELELPAGWHLVAHSQAHQAASVAGSGEWVIPVDALLPGQVLHGHAWIAVAPGSPAGEHRLSLTARGETSAAPAPVRVHVPVTVVQGAFGSGRLVARVVPVDGEPWAPPSMVFQVLGGPRLRTDAAGRVSWTGPPGLYLLVPDRETLPPGWRVPVVPFRLQAGAVTSVEVPAASSTRAGVGPLVDGAFALETGPDGTQAAGAIAGQGGARELRFHYRSTPMPTGVGAPGQWPAGPEPAADVRLPLGLPWAGPVQFYIAGHYRHGVDHGLYASLMAGGDASRLWRLHVGHRGSSQAAGLLWLRSQELGTVSQPDDLVGAHWQLRRGPGQLAVQVLAPLDGTGARGTAWGVAAAAPMGGAWQIEGFYRFVPQDFNGPWMEEGPRPGWTVDVRGRPAGGLEWRGTLATSGGDGLDLDLAVRRGYWQIRQGLLQNGAWRPATEIRWQWPGTGLWAGVRTDAETPLRWQLGASAGPWSWSVQSGAGEGQLRLGWHGPGPRGATLRLQATLHTGEGQPPGAGAAGTGAAGSLAPAGPPGPSSRGFLERTQWRLAWERRGVSGDLWRGELVWQPREPTAAITFAVGWHGLGTAARHWTEGELRWRRDVDGDSWEARYGGHWSLGPAGDMSGQLLGRRTWQEEAGALYTLQLAVTGRRALTNAWHGLVGLRWWTQWSDAAQARRDGTDIDLGLSRELGTGWWLAAGWRWSLGDGEEQSGPYARLEWQPGVAFYSAHDGGAAASGGLPEDSPRDLP